MALKDGTLLSSGTAPPNYSVSALTETKQRMEDFLADPKKLERTRELLKGELTPEQRKVLTLFERTFKCYIMENPDAKVLREEATKIEGSLESERNKCAPLLSEIRERQRVMQLYSVIRDDRCSRPELSHPQHKTYSAAAARADLPRPRTASPRRRLRSPAPLRRTAASPAQAP
jgi:hypothetical protein